MNLDTINKLIKLKEDEVLEIGVVYPNFDKEKLSILNYIDSEFEELINKFYSDIIAVSVIITGIFNKEIYEDIKNNEVKDVLKFELSPSKEGFKVDIKSYYLDKHMIEIRNGNFRENIDNLVNMFESLKRGITKNVNDIVNKNLELSEVGKIREYTLLYENGKNITKGDFVVYTDRPIKEQKAEIQELINNGLTSSLYDDVIENNPELIDKKFAVKFTLINGTDIEDIKIGEF